MKALVLLSGGQDSALCLGWAVRNFDSVFSISFDYGQRHRSELLSSLLLSKFFGVVNHFEISLGRIFPGNSPLVNSNYDLEEYVSNQEMNRVIGDRQEVTMVPMRNSVFLDLAASFAYVNNIGNIVTGVSGDDSANYDDCREDYIKAMAESINMALGLDHRSGKEKISILTPIINLSKSECVKMGLSVPGVYESWAYTTTAYDGKYPPKGKDHASVLRAHGFEEAGIPDPLVVRAYLEKKMDLPGTSNYDIVRNSEISTVGELGRRIGARSLEFF